MKEDSNILGFDANSLIDRFCSVEKLEEFTDSLLNENKRHNLVSRETGRDDIKKLFAESLLPLTLVDLPLENYLDIGSGGGLPALPIILSGSVVGDAMLLDRSHKKTAALRRLGYALDIRFGIETAEFERFKTETRYDLISIRLVTLTNTILNHVMSLLSEGGKLVYFSKPACPVDKYDSIVYTFSTSYQHTEKELTVLSNQQQ